MPTQLLENMAVIDTIIEILFPNNAEFERIFINAVNHKTTWTAEDKRDLVLDLLRQRLSLHATAALRTTNATLMHQNADLTRENENYRAKQDAYNQAIERSREQSETIVNLRSELLRAKELAAAAPMYREKLFNKINRVLALEYENETLKSELSNLKLKYDAVWHSADLANDTIKYITDLIRYESANPAEKYLLTKISQYIVTWQPSPPIQIVGFNDPNKR